MKQICIIFCLAVSIVLTMEVPVSVAASTEDAAWQKVVEAGRREGVINLASSALSGKAGVDISNAFKEKYGISIELISGRILNTIEKIKMEQKSKSYVTDAIDSVAAFLNILKKEGYIESVAGALPVLNEKEKFLHALIEGPEAQFLSVMDVPSLYWINTNLVKSGQEPRSFHDLLDPKWKGKLLLMNPLYNSGPEELILVFSKANTGLNEDFFIKLYKSATLAGTGGAEEVIDKIVRGEYAIGGFVGGQTAMKPFLAGAPIKPLDLKEGNMFKQQRWGAIKNAPHPNATKVFINWLLSKEGQLLASKATGLEGVRNDIPSVMPFRFKGPIIHSTYELVLLADERFEAKYMANLLGIKR